MVVYTENYAEAINKISEQHADFLNVKTKLHIKLPPLFKS
jgi:hypothetical protein